MNRSRGRFRHPPRRTFRDRREAGRVLADQLNDHRRADGLLVLGLARGGVPVGWEVASALHAPLDVFLVRKLGVPRWTELAMGALTSGGSVVMNEDVMAGLDIGDGELREVIDRETAELKRREQAYRSSRPAANPRGKAVILVDDGIATGASMLAAVRAVRTAGAASITVAVPVGPPSVCQRLAQEADDVLCATSPPSFEAVGQVFADFHQITDDEVRDRLATTTRLGWETGHANG